MARCPPPRPAPSPLPGRAGCKAVCSRLRLCQAHEWGMSPSLVVLVVRCTPPTQAGQVPTMPFPVLPLVMRLSCSLFFLSIRLLVLCRPTSRPAAVAPSARVLERSAGSPKRVRASSAGGTAAGRRYLPAVVAAAAAAAVMVAAAAAVAAVMAAGVGASRQHRRRGPPQGAATRAPWATRSCCGTAAPSGTAPASTRSSVGAPCRGRGRCFAGALTQRVPLRRLLALMTVPPRCRWAGCSPLPPRRPRASFLTPC